MDGTLIESMYYWNRALIRVLYDNGILADDTDEEALNRLGFFQFPAYLIDKYNLKCSAEGFFKRVDKLMLYKYRHEALLKPNVKEYLKQLKSKQVRIVILTASKMVFVKTLIQRFKLAPYIDDSFSASALGIEKSDPNIYRVLFSQLGCAAEDCVLFEDSVYAVKAASEIGIRSVGILDPFFCQQHQELRQLCFRTINRFSELLDQDVFS
jgi:HAD superfamily hydrolase (TIGR01509 family)